MRQPSGSIDQQCEIPFLDFTVIIYVFVLKEKERKKRKKGERCGLAAEGEK